MLQAKIEQLQQANLQLRHDLLQPLTAARLFTSALLEREPLTATAALVRQVNESLADAQKLLDELLWDSSSEASVPEPAVMPDSLALIQPLAGARIWVLDNDASICLGMRLLLEGWGCQVVTAASEAELLCQVANAGGDADLLIVDYHLQDGRTGINAVSSINASRPLPLPVLMVTANHSDELKQQLREQGHGLLHKPVAPAKLRAILVHLLSAARH
jgi:CheY-like chemotaxis protein